MNERILSKRLRQIANYLPEKANFADIGSDHAYLPCFVCSQDKNATAIAGEINEGPYRSAERNVAALHLTDQVKVIKGDGLAVLHNQDVDQVVIAGMGGTLIRTILMQGKDKLTNVQRIIAQPNVDAYAVRDWFYNNNYHLIAEEIIKEDGHIYEILIADKEVTAPIYDEKQLMASLLFGPYLLKENSAVFQEKWASEKSKLERVVKQMHQAKEIDYEKIKQFQYEIEMIEEVLGHD